MLKKSKSLRRVSKIIERQGTAAVKVLVTLTVGKVRLPISPSLYEVMGNAYMEALLGCEVSACFERGGKLASSRHHKLARVTDLDEEREYLEIDFQEALSLVVTVYRENSTMNYQEKYGKLVVRRRDGASGRDRFIGLGIVDINIATLLNGNDKNVMISYPLSKCDIPHSIIYFLSEAKLLEELSDVDDSMTNISGLSDISCSAADFETPSHLVPVEAPRRRSSWFQKAKSLTAMRSPPQEAVKITPQTNLSLSKFSHSENGGKTEVQKLSPVMTQKTERAYETSLGPESQQSKAQQHYSFESSFTDLSIDLNIDLNDDSDSVEEDNDNNSPSGEASSLVVMKNECKRLSSLNEVYRKELIDCQKKCDEAIHKNESLEKSNNKWKEKFQSLQAIIDEKNAQEMHLKSELCDATQKIAHLESVANGLRTSICEEGSVGSLSKELSSKQDKEIQSLQQKHILLTKQLESKEENLSELQLKKEVLEHREKKLSAKIEKLNAMLKHSEEVIDRQRSQIENLRNELIDTEAKADSLSTETYHLNSGRLQLETANKSLRIELSETLKRVEELETTLQAEVSDKLFQLGEVDENTVCSWNEDSVCNESNASTMKDEIELLKRKVEAFSTAESDNNAVIENLKRHIDSITSASNTKIDELLHQNNEIVTKLNKASSELDVVRANYEESEKKLMTLVTEKSNIQSDLEIERAQVIYLRSRENSLKSSTTQTFAYSTSRQMENETSIEMINSLLEQNKKLLASNAVWEQKFESIDAMSRAAIKNRDSLIEDTIKLKCEIDERGKELTRLEHSHSAMKVELSMCQDEVKRLRQHRSDPKPEEDGSSNVRDNNCATSDSENEYLLQELIEAKMKAASAALEHDTQAKSSPGATGHGSGKEDDLVHQIIEAKMTAASLALEKDEQGKRIVGLKRLIQHYAERVATLEVAAAKNASSRLSPTLSPNATNVLLSGPLYFKKNSSMFNSSWKWEKRYFELQADRIVYFSKEDGSEPSGELRLSSAATVMSDVDNQSSRNKTFRSFTIESLGKKMSIGADSDTEIALWKDAICQAIHKLQ